MDARPSTMLAMTHRSNRDAITTSVRFHPIQLAARRLGMSAEDLGGAGRFKRAGPMGTIEFSACYVAHLRFGTDLHGMS